MRAVKSEVGLLEMLQNRPRKKKLDSAQSFSMMAYSFLVIAGKKNFQRLGKDADDIVVYFFGIISEPTGNG